MPVKFLLKDGNFKNYVESGENFANDTIFYEFDYDLYICNTNSPKDLLQFLPTLIGTKACFVYISTNKVYKTHNREYQEQADCIRSIPYDETDEIFIPKEDKELAKTFTCESIVHEFCSVNKIHSCVFRPGCIVGYPLDVSDGFLAKTILCATSKTKLPIYGKYGVKQVRDQMHVSDFIRAIKDVYASNVCGEIFNIGGGLNHAISIQQLNTKLNNIGYPVEVDILEKEVLTNPYYVTNFKKFYELTNWTPCYDPVSRALFELRPF